jgi:hypothetical protein
VVLFHIGDLYECLKDGRDSTSSRHKEDPIHVLFSSLYVIPNVPISMFPPC